MVLEVGIERPDGPVVEALLRAGLTAFVIAPNQIKHLRRRYGAAGNAALDRKSLAALKTPSAQRLADAALSGQPLAWLNPPQPAT
ncbi:hypothetical protein ACFT9M_07810 [Micromonospora purpureochromogenes]|uniref:hypothetical protein n=1 Tax=Micromonospora purpureochromogenes TaxID=47872 RepID=UPI00363732AC